MPMQIPFCCRPNIVHYSSFSVTLSIYIYICMLYSTYLFLVLGFSVSIFLSWTISLFVCSSSRYSFLFFVSFLSNVYSLFLSFFFCAARGQAATANFHTPVRTAGNPSEKRNTANERAVDHKSNNPTKARFLARRETFRSKARHIFCCRCFSIFFFWWMLVTQRR